MEEWKKKRRNKIIWMKRRRRKRKEKIIKRIFLKMRIKVVRKNRKKKH